MSISSPHTAQDQIQNINNKDFYNEIERIDRLRIVAKTTPPTVNDDFTKGFDIGSQWYDETNDRFYVCLDNAEGVAVWQDYVKRTGDTMTGDYEIIGTFKTGDGTNYTKFESDGTVLFTGDATAWEDIQVGISNIRVPAANAPTERLYDGGTGGVTFPFLGFAVNDYLYFDVQTSHSMKLNTILDQHIHFSLPNTTNIGDKFQFQLDVMAAGLDTAWAVPAGSPFTNEHTIVANDDTYHRLLDVADIDSSNDTVSSIYKCKLTRIAATSDEYGSEVYVTGIDCHYEKDTVGSRTELAK